MDRTAHRHQQFRRRNWKAGKDHPEWSQRRTAEMFSRHYARLFNITDTHKGD